MNEQIRAAIIEIVKDVFAEQYGIICTVDSVDENELTCDCVPINGDSDILDVRIQAGVGDGIIKVPKVGSVVIVQPINEQTGYISLYSDIESIKFLDGSYGGLIKINDLVDRINVIEDDINDLKTVFSTWVVVANDGGAALKAAAATWLAQQLIKTKTSDIENDKITHGDN